jgi:hypothetical protein
MYLTLDNLTEAVIMSIFRYFYLDNGEEIAMTWDKAEEVWHDTDRDIVMSDEEFGKLYVSAIRPNGYGLAVVLFKGVGA